DLMVREGHSRIPAYRENVDQIVGIVYSKDLLKQWQEGKLEKPAKELMRPPYFIPETKRVNELLREFQRHKISVAIVIDEYGGTAGLVTMEDLLEEIVGEISDHWEKKAPDFQKLPDGTILVNGKMEIERVNEELEMGLPEENDVETLAGFILSYVGRFPKVGETFRFKNLSFTIQTADEHSISLVQIKRLDLKTDKKIR
ncbi:MAG: hemolysin, partial [bacterium (Candidatus Ratteibacteria) CG01_land_8_20_14_3_00_40_19]